MIRALVHRLTRVVVRRAVGPVPSQADVDRWINHVG